MTVLTDAPKAAAGLDSTARRAARSRLADALVEEHDAGRARATRLACATPWTPVETCGKFAGGPPAIAARLYKPEGKDWPRLRLSLRSDAYGACELVACVKAADDGKNAWETVGLPRGLLAEAGKLLTEVGKAA